MSLSNISDVPLPSVSMRSCAPCASSAPVAADDIEDDVEDCDNDLQQSQNGELATSKESVMHTVAIAPTIIIMMLAIAEMTASMAPAMAETTVPCTIKPFRTLL